MLIKTMLFFLVCLSLEGGDWQADWAKGVKLASKEGKSILLVMAGTGWNSWCKKLDAEVLSKGEFIRQAKEDFVLVRLEFPKDLKQSQKITIQNRKMAERYFIKSLPTMLMLDISGKPYAKILYLNGGVSKYMGLIKQYKLLQAQRILWMKEAKTLDGVEKAKKFIAVYNSFEENVLVHYQDLKVDIYKNDPDDKSGFKKVQMVIMELFELEKKALKLIREKKRVEALKLFENFLQRSALTVAIKQRALFAQLACYKIIPENYDVVYKLMDSIIALNGDSLTALKASRVKDVIKGRRGSEEKTLKE